MSPEDKSRLQGILKALAGAFNWEIIYTDWDAYMCILDDLEFEEVKVAFLDHSRNSLRFPDPTGIRNTVLFNRKLTLAGLAAHNAL